MSKDLEIRFNLRPRSSAGISFEQPSLTDPSGAAEADINYIIRKYETTGSLVDPLSVDTSRVPAFADVSSRAASDYQSALNKVIRARQLFDDLPASVRRRFGDDPKEMLRFIGDEKNREEAIQLGLIVPPAPAPESAPVESVSPEGTADSAGS